MGSEDIKRQSLNVYRMKLLGADVVPVTSGFAHAEGCDERSDARLGHQRRRYALHHRHRRRTASVSDDGARLSVGHRAGSARAVSAADRTLAGHARRVRRRRIERDWPVPSVRRRLVGSIRRRRSGGPGARDRQARRDARRPECPACCTAIAPICWRTTTARSSRRIRSRRASTIPASVPSTRISRTSAAPTTFRSPTTRHCRRFAIVTQVEGIMPALESSHALAWVREYAPRAPRDEIVIVNLSGRGDKDILTVAAIDGIVVVSRIRSAIERAATFGSQGARRVHHRWRSRTIDDGARDARAGRGRRGRHRGRRAVFGSGGRRSGDSEKFGAGAWRPARDLIDVFDMVREFRARDATTPVLLMGYLNSVERMGYREFVDARGRRRRRRNDRRESCRRKKRAN